MFLAAAAVLAAVALAVPSAASAACAPQTQTFSDTAGDSEYLQAPDITSVTVSVDAACTITFTDGLSNRPSLTAYDTLQWAVDVDNDRATGRNGQGYFVGSDYGLALRGDGAAALFDKDGALVMRITALPFGVSLPASAIGITENSTIRIMANALTVPAGRSWIYSDEAPNVAAAPVIFQMHPAAEAPPASPVTPPTPPTPAAPSEPVVQCVVPKLTGLTLAAARTKLTAAHCSLGAVRKHRARGRTGVVLASRPTVGSSAPDGTKVAVTVRARRR
jgi:hypothetical protein